MGKVGATWQCKTRHKTEVSQQVPQGLGEENDSIKCNCSVGGSIMLIAPKVTANGDYPAYPHVYHV